MPKYVQASAQQPAAGADFSFCPSNSDSFKLLSVRAVLAVAADDTTLQVNYQFVTPSSDIAWECASQALPAAASTGIFQWTKSDAMVGSEPGEEITLITNPIPNFWWPAGTIFRTAMKEQAADDQWSDIYYIALVGDEFEHLQRLERLTQQLSTLIGLASHSE